MTPQPEVDIANYLASGVLASPYSGFTYGASGQIKTGSKKPMRSPEGAGVRIWVNVIGGITMPMSNARFSGSHRQPRVQVLSLSVPDTEDEGLALARAVFAALHCHDVPNALLATTIAAGSAGATLPVSTLDVASTTGLPTSGRVVVATTTGQQTLNFTGLAAGQFTGCSGGTGTLAGVGGLVAIPYVGVQCDPARGEPLGLGADEAQQYEFVQEFLLDYFAVN